MCVNKHNFHYEKLSQVVFFYFALLDLMDVINSYMKKE